MKKDLFSLFESNILILDRLSDRLKRDPTQLLGFPRQQLSILVRLHMAGKARLKDIARREFSTTPNLCAAFRKLEKEGLVEREIDATDRRNTWYSVTAKGETVALQALQVFKDALKKLFADISKQDEEDLEEALKTINRVLTKLEMDNA